MFQNIEMEWLYTEDVGYQTSILFKDRKVKINTTVNKQGTNKGKEYTQIYHQLVAQCFVFIIQSSYMFRPYILAIFRELQVWSTCTVYMAICHVTR
jgi:hypothetical protein